MYADYTYDEAHALKSIHKLRLAASGIKCTNERYDDIDDDDDSLAVYTKQDILKELPDNAIIYSGNWNPGLKPGSVPRGLFTDQDYCWRGNAGEGLPPPSAADLFSPRPLPNLSRGRQPMNPPQNPKGQKRAMEDDQNPKSQKKPAKAVAAD